MSNPGIRPARTPGATEPLPRIAMVSTHGYVAANPPLGAADTGGQVVYVLELSKKLAAFGYDVDIWTRRFLDQPEIEAVDERVRIIRARCGGREFIPKEVLHESLPEWCESALRFIRKHELRYEFINSHYWDAGLAAQQLRNQLHTVHAHTPHSLGLWKMRQMETDSGLGRDALDQKYNFTRRIHNERLIYHDADLIVATTPVQIDMLETDYEVPADKVRMIPPGYDDTRFFPVGEATRQGIRSRLGFSGNVILTLGRLAANKGYDLLIEAFELVAARDPDAKLILAVGGEKLDASEEKLLGELEAQVRRLGLAGRVEFTGFVPDEALADYYRAADQFVLSSRYEPFGMTAIEAMACGTPTVVTVHGGLWRALTFGRHALFADTFDREDLGIMMLKPFKLPRLRARLAKMGAHKARSLFTWSGIAHQLLAALERRPGRAVALADTEPDWDEPWIDGD